MAETLMIQSIVTDNRITAQFTDKALPRYARHGELYVVNGILYIYADLDDSNIGKWFPLTDEKEIYTFEAVVGATTWTIPIDFHTDNVQVIIYDQDGKFYPKDFDINIDNQVITVNFEEEVRGQAYVIINKAFDWMDRRLIVADRRFAVTENEDDVNQYFIEIDTEYVEILKNGNTTLRSDVTIGGQLTVTGTTTFDGDQSLAGDVTIGGDLETNGTITSINHFFAKMNATVEGDLTVKGNTVLEGNLTVTGTTTTVNTEEMTIADNIITLNSNATTAVENAGIEVERGSEDNKTIIQWDETNDVTNIPNDAVIDGTFLNKSNTTINGTLQVDGDINTNSNTSITGTLTVGGASSLNSTLAVASDATIGGTTTITGATTVNNTLTVTGETIINGDTTTDGSLLVKTDTTVNGVTTLVGDTTINGNLTVDTNAVVTGTTNLVGDTTVDGDTLIKSNLTVDGDTLTKGNDTTEGSLLVKTNAVIQGTMQVDGDMNIDGNFTISGNAGSNVDISTTTLTVDDNIVTINKGTTGAPTENAGLEVDRGDEGMLSIITFDETNDKMVIPVLQQNGTFLQDEIAGKIYTADEINKETVRATVAETTLTNSLNTEVTDRTTADTTLTTAISDEETARTTADTTITTNLSNEVTRATSSEDTLRSDITALEAATDVDTTTLQDNIDTEATTRATNDDTLTTNLATETTRATAVESDLQSQITAEATRATTTEGDLSTLTTTDKSNIVNAINEEMNRATTSETTIATSISTETTNRENADNSLSTSISTETTNREDADTTLQTNITAEETARTNADTTLTTNLTNEVTRATDREDTIDAKFSSYISNTQTTIQELNSDLTVNESVVIKKDLTVEGTTTTVNATSVEVDDNKLILNSSVTTGAPTQDANVNIRRGDEGENTVIKWYENGDASEVQISEWDSTTSQFTERAIATQNYSDTNLNAVDTALTTRIDSLESTTSATETTLTDSLNTEITRAKSSEGDLTSLTTTDTSDLVSAINSEVTRATDSEATLTTDLSNEVTRATTKDNQLQTDLTNETDRAVLADSTLTTDLSNEVTRATTVEGDISTLTTVSKTDITTAINSLKTEVDSNASTTATTVSDMFTKSGDDITFKGNLIPALDSTFNIGSADKKIKEVYVSANTIYLGENTIISELGLQLAGSLTSTTLTTTTLVADNVYDKTTVDLNISNVETELGGAITTLETAHNDLVTIVSNDSLSKSTTETQSVTGEVNFSTNLTVQGDLNVVGTQTTTDVVNLSVENNEVVLNSGTTGVPYLDASLRVDRGDLGIQDVIVWKELGNNSSVQVPYMNTNNELVMDTVVTTDALATIINATSNASTVGLDNEILSRTAGDLNLQTQVTTEVTRAKDIEGTLSSLSSKLVDGNGDLPTSLVGAINKAVSNASTNESNIIASISTETTRATAEEAIITTSVATETSRATTKETAIETNLSTEITRATTVEGVLTSGLSAEKQRAQNVESTLTTDLASEVTRALNIEGSLQTNIDNINATLSTDAERLAAIQSFTEAFNEADQELSGAITTLGATISNDIAIETNRAQAIENTLISNLNVETNRAKAVEGILIQLETTEQGNLVSSINEVHTDVDSETSRATDAEQVLTTNLTTEAATRLSNDNTLQANLDSVATNRYTKSETDNAFVSVTGGTINGDLTINGKMTATEIVETSSIRFKENVKSIENAFDTISQLQGVTYDWKETGKSDIGFIAEEVDKVIPELVSKTDGVVDGMNYSKLTAMLVEVVKSQQAQIEELKLDVDFLKRK